MIGSDAPDAGEIPQAARRMSLPMKALESDLEETLGNESKEAPPGFEPGLADLQSAALPLG